MPVVPRHVPVQGEAGESQGAPLSRRGGGARQSEAARPPGGVRLLRQVLHDQRVAQVPRQALLREDARDSVPAMRQVVLHEQQPQEASEALPSARRRRD